MRINCETEHFEKESADRTKAQPYLLFGWKNYFLFRKSPFIITNEMNKEH